MRAPWRSARSRSIGARLAGLALVVPLSGCSFTVFDIPLPGGLDEDESMTITADFDDALNVVPRSAVMVSDVPVGEVVEVERHGWTARVEMRIREDVEIPANARAEIRQTSLLGEKYVALEAPEGKQARGLMTHGTHLERSATGRNPEVEEVLGALSTLLSGGGVAQLGTITRELNTAMTGRTDDMRQMLGRLDGVIATLDEQKGDIVRTLRAVNRLSRTLNAERDVIGDAIRAMGPAVEVVSEQTESLVAVLRSLDRLGRIGTDVIEATRSDLVSILEDLRPVAARLNEAGDALARGLSLALSFPFPKESDDMVFGDYANTNFWLEVGLQNKLGDDEPPLGEEPPPSGGGGGSDPGLPDLGLPDLGLPDLGLGLRPGPDGRREGGGGLLGTLGIADSGTRAAMARCLESDSIISADCEPWLATTDHFVALAVACDAAEVESPVCQVLGRVGVDPDVAESPLGRGLDPYSRGLTTAFDSPVGTARDLFSGGAA